MGGHLYFFIHKFFRDPVSPSLIPSTVAIFIGDDGQDPVDLDVKFVGLMPVAPANPPGGLAALATVAPAAVAPAAATPVAAAVGANRGVRGRDQEATQHHQAIIAAGNIGDPQVFLLGIRGISRDGGIDQC